MVGRVVNSLLHLFGAILDSLWMVGRPQSSKVLSVDGEFQYLRVIVLDVAEDLENAVVKLRD